MPVVNFNDPAVVGWMNGAERLLGIPLHPLGESNYIDHFAILPGTMKEHHHRLLAMQKACLISVFMFCLFLNNSIISLRMVVARPHALSSWCCLISSVSGLIIGILTALTTLGTAIHCRMTIWSVGFGIAIASICNSTILLQKSYIALNRRRWILYLSIPLVLGQAFFPVTIMEHTFIKVEEKLSCTFYYPYYFIWYWVLINAPVNTFFSAIFCYIAYQKYCNYGSDTWRQLVRDGLQTIGLALVCNIVFTMLIILQLHIINPDHFYIADW
ncbi:hypothetical protein SYNPS1DRAFT_20669 [Syncephalis pseudoplumigaleata]|uniref:Uncharacterized protein n=1 Tax=Syncephalis pseudoplumigaleata TaxID=1712513 RepID=A0A4P9Z7Q2_9FUNG|nr:hypothetical protein SYNPS1DRAFT_20669 [Syncephalis pseudoplumigaleata]|eukprot:RKP27941.1 hypothetical protein SYNPS1DRAFT_20669 [Syncephalis pseudoplumigaleata]